MAGFTALRLESQIKKFGRSALNVGLSRTEVIDLFRSDGYPWRQQWMSYGANGWRQRGLEFATQPYHAPLRAHVSLAAGEVEDLDPAPTI